VPPPREPLTWWQHTFGRKTDGKLIAADR
jgi:hypothetical protein